MLSLAAMKGKAQGLVGKATEELMAKFPDLPTLTLAKKLIADFPELYNSVESARGAVRYYRGSKGKHNREIRGITEFEPAKQAIAMGIPNPFFLPSDLPDVNLSVAIFDNSSAL